MNLLQIPTVANDTLQQMAQQVTTTVGTPETTINAFDLAIKGQNVAPIPKMKPRKRREKITSISNYIVCTVFKFHLNLAPRYTIPL
jgi:hypothetical protein